MHFMFYDCSGLTALDLSNFNTSNVTDMSGMLWYCSALTSINLSNFDTSNVTNMGGMFAVGEILTSDSALAALDLSNFDTSKVTNMSSMFFGCSKLTSLDLSSFDTSNVTVMSYMFGNCSNLTTIKGIIDMKSCTNYGTIEKDNGIYNIDSRMFSKCSKLKDVKIRNPPAGFDGAGLSSSQYTIVS